MWHSTVCFPFTAALHGSALTVDCNNRSQHDKRASHLPKAALAQEDWLAVLPQLIAD